MLINLPPPPSDPVTPNEPGPGTPNSTTTSLSALSVVAIKDGAAGHNTHSHFHSRNQPPSSLEAERADRISRLAGLERVATVRANPSGNMASGSGPHPSGMIKEISTVGTASATGSVGGKTTWASESMDYEADKMSEDTTPEPDGDHDNDEDTSSAGGLSDGDKASLVGFGEGAGSTVSGPISTANARMLAARNSMNNPAQHPPTPRTHPFASQPGGSGGSTPMSGVERLVGDAGSTDPKMMDGISFDQGVVDTTVSTPPLIDRNEMMDPAGRPPPHASRFSGVGAEMAEHAMRDRIDDSNPRGLDTPPNQQNLGRFGFEKD